MITQRFKASGFAVKVPPSHLTKSFTVHFPGHGQWQKGGGVSCGLQIILNKTIFIVNGIGIKFGY